MRVLFTLLLLLNLLLWVWQHWGTVAPRATTNVGAPPVPAPLQADACLLLGPLKSEDLAAQLARGLRERGHIVELVRREERVLLGHGVYLPVPGSVQEAEQLTEALARAGIHDYALAVDGPHRNALLLGLYPQPAAAEARRAELLEAGFQPRIEQRHALRQQVSLYLHHTGDAVPPAPNGYVWRPTPCAPL